MFKKFCIIFFAGYALVWVATSREIMLDYCFVLPSQYRTAEAKKLFNWVYFDEAEWRRNENYSEDSCIPKGVGSATIFGRGLPAFYLYVASYGKPTPSGLWYPKYLALNLLWIAGASLLIAYPLHKIMRKRKKRETNK